jgi:hypothetical protein
MLDETEPLVEMIPAEPRHRRRRAVVHDDHLQVIVCLGERLATDRRGNSRRFRVGMTMVTLGTCKRGS